MAKIRAMHPEARVHMDAENCTLSAKQQRTVIALLTCKTVAEAARAAQVSERSIYKWLKMVDFRQALSLAEGELIDQAVRRLLRLQDLSIDTIEAMLGDADASQAVRLRASQLVLEITLKLREQRDVEQRLSALEQAAGALV